MNNFLVNRGATLVGGRDGVQLGCFQCAFHFSRLCVTLESSAFRKSTTDDEVRKFLRNGTVFERKFGWYYFLAHWREPARTARIYCACFWTRALGLAARSKAHGL